ncbi:hypothetical protein HNY73_015409 [Argiope bruennichi]|uniref:Uncharacterized protein n=1 Tax=Argiope bruennichi TaxID=94029 RepID=A0A8T0ERZ3_ARGBR|nr:hypothetical protein HNY73_015409 [Argiope bruennichi]
MEAEFPMEIRKFAAIVVIKYSNLLTIQPDSRESLDEFTRDSSYKEIFNSIKLMLKFYKEFIDEISTDILEERGVLSSKKEYMTYLVTRCLKLSEGDPTFFEFLLVCVYIAKMTEGLFAKYKCCKILKVTADSLEAVYCRKYWVYFKENDDFLGFSRFCEDLNKSSHYVEFKNGKCMTLFKTVEPARNEKVKNFTSLNDISDDISLNFMEGKLLQDKTFSLPCPFDSFPRGRGDFLISTTLGAGEDSRDLEMEDWEIVPEKAIKTGIYCSYCRASCFQYLAYCVTEFPRCKNIPESLNNE